MDIEGTLVIRVNKKTGEETSRELINIRPATKTMEEYLAPAAEYLYHRMMNDHDFWERWRKIK